MSKEINGVFISYKDMKKFEERPTFIPNKVGRPSKRVVINGNFNRNR